MLGRIVRGRGAGRRRGARRCALLQLGASLLLLVVAAVSGLIALVLGALMLMQRRADRDAATR